MNIRLVTDYLDLSAEKYPDKVAFADSAREITFSEVKSESQKIAALLAKKKLF